MLDTLSKVLGSFWHTSNHQKEVIGRLYPDPLFPVEPVPLPQKYEVVSITTIHLADALLAQGSGWFKHPVKCTAQVRSTSSPVLNVIFQNRKGELSYPWMAKASLAGFNKPTHLITSIFQTAPRAEAVVETGREFLRPYRILCHVFEERPMMATTRTPTYQL